MTSGSHLALTRLEKVRHAGGKIIARCPACAEGGGDRKGDHLVILPSGKFACAAMQGDGEHRRRIFALVGVAGERASDPEMERRWREDRSRERQQEVARRRLVATARTKRSALIDRHEWAAADVWDDSPQRIDCDLVEYDPRHFLASLFSGDATVWTGEKEHSGQGGRHADCWKTVAEWKRVEHPIGPMVTPATWTPGTTSRTAANVVSAPFTVLDFDGLDGVAPVTPVELENHFRAALAITRWLREGLGWELAAIIHTGNKSVHAWFHTPPQDVLDSLKVPACALGLDAGLIGRPEHPCRLPGHAHGKTGRRARVLWLQSPLFHSLPTPTQP